MISKSPRCFLPLALVLLAGGGCSHFDLRKGIPWGAGEDGEFERPIKVVSMWTDTVLSQSDGSATRGFGGRLMFYAEEDGKPIKVKGKLVVYAFEETNRDPSNVAPDRKYVLTEEEFEDHYSKSSLGHSYSVWLPWDRAGGLQTEISLLVRFMAEDGSVIIGQQSTHVLPGAPNPNVRSNNPSMRLPAASTPPPGVQQAAYQAAVPAQTGPDQTVPAAQSPTGAGQPWTTEPKQRMTTSTISLDHLPGNRLPVAAVNNRAIMPAARQPSLISGGTTAAIAPQAQAAAAPPAARFAPARSRPLGEPIAQLDRDRGPWRPHHVGWPSAAGLQPAPATPTQSPASSGTAGSAAY